jgi:two-component system cell cycle response regulator
MRVLVIDDDPPSRLLVEYLLRKAGHTVVAAESAPRGFQQAKSARYDVILSGVFMRGLSGLDLARQLKNDEALRSTRLLAITALAMNGDEDRILSAGFDGYLSKPVDPQTFVESVELLGS